MRTGPIELLKLISPSEASSISGIAMERVNTISPKTRKALIRFLADSDETAREMCLEVLSNGHYRSLREVEHELLLITQVAPVVNAFNEPHTDHVWLLDTVQFIESFYRSLYGKRAPSKLIRAYAVIYCAALDDERSLSDLRFIDENLDRPKLHARVIIEHETTERSFLESLLENPSPALAVGTL